MILVRSFAEVTTKKLQQQVSHDVKALKKQTSVVDKKDAENEEEVSARRDVILSYHGFLTFVARVSRVTCYVY